MVTTSTVPRAVIVSTTKYLLKRLLPEHTKRRLGFTLLLTLVTRPHRLRYRVNRQNIRDYRRFGRTKAHCCICGSTGTLFFDMPDVELCRHHGIDVLRETLSCRSCGSTNRQRNLANALISVLHRQFACEGTALYELTCRTGKVEIWDTDAFGPIGAGVRSVANVTRSKYLPQLPFGVEAEQGVYNIDLQQVSFPSNRFDVILTSDVMEHVRDDRCAHEEIFRCLRPGGVYLFTVPYAEDRARTLRLVDTSSAEDVFLEPPHYHGDPISGKILAYRIYGRDLIERLEEVGFEARFEKSQLADEGIFGGDCFIATKPSGEGDGNHSLGPSASRGNR
jgi:SAM-dependent methyltransferase